MILTHKVGQTDPASECHEGSLAGLCHQICTACASGMDAPTDRFTSSLTCFSRSQGSKCKNQIFSKLVAQIITAAHTHTYNLAYTDLLLHTDNCRDNAHITFFYDDLKPHLVGLRRQDYNYLCAAVTICATLVNIQTDNI